MAFSTHYMGVTSTLKYFECHFAQLLHVQVDASVSAVYLQSICMLLEYFLPPSYLFIGIFTYRAHKCHLRGDFSPLLNCFIRNSKNPREEENTLRSVQ